MVRVVLFGALSLSTLVVASPVARPGGEDFNPQWNNNGQPNNNDVSPASPPDPLYPACSSTAVPQPSPVNPIIQPSSANISPVIQSQPVNANPIVQPTSVPPIAIVQPSPGNVSPVDANPVAQSSHVGGNPIIQPSAMNSNPVAQPSPINPNTLVQSSPNHPSPVVQPSPGNPISVAKPAPVNSYLVVQPSVVNPNPIIESSPVNSNSIVQPSPVNSAPVVQSSAANSVTPPTLQSPTIPFDPTVHSPIPVNLTVPDGYSMGFSTQDWEPVGQQSICTTNCQLPHPFFTTAGPNPLPPGVYAGALPPYLGGAADSCDSCGSCWHVISSGTPYCNSDPYDPACGAPSGPNWQSGPQSIKVLVTNHCTNCVEVPGHFDINQSPDGWNNPRIFWKSIDASECL